MTKKVMLSALCCAMTCAVCASDGQTNLRQVVQQTTNNNDEYEGNQNWIQGCRGNTSSAHKKKNKDKRFWLQCKWVRKNQEQIKSEIIMLSESVLSTQQEDGLIGAVLIW